MTVLTKVVGMPTDSAASNATVKLRLVSVGVNSEYGIWSGK